MRICRLIFSTNRIEFLVPTLESHKNNIDFGNHDVVSLLIDDYPKDRDNDQIKDILDSYKIDLGILHSENVGITETWAEAWNLIKEQNFDYIWHHEDDVVFKQPIKIQTLIDFLNTDNKKYCQVTLKRNPWYKHELNESLLYDSDFDFNEYKITLRDDYFWSLASLYPHWISKENIQESQGCNPGEWPIMQHLKQKYDMRTAIIKNKDGSNIVEHIGVYFKGKRVSEGEPGWEKFKTLDPNVKYCSRSGIII